MSSGASRVQRKWWRMRGIALVPALCLLCFCGRNPWLSKESLVARGNEFYSKGLYEEASIQYKKAIQKDPRYGEAHYRLGLALLKQNDPGAAYASFEEALRLMPGHEDSMAQLAGILLNAYLTNPNRPEALRSRIGDYLSQMLAKNPQSFSAQRIQAFLAAGEGRPQDAVRFFQAAERLRPGECDINTGLVQNLLAANRTAEAEQWATAYIPKHANCGPVYDVLYAHYLARNRVSEAESLLKSKVAANPTVAFYAIQLADHYRRQKQPELMEQTITQLIAKTPPVPDAYLEAGDFYTRNQRWDQALTLYQRGSAAEPKRKTEYSKRIVSLYLHQGKTAEAAQILDSLLVANPKDFDALASRAALRLSTGKPEETARAIADLEGAVKEAPEDVRYRFELARAYLQAQKFPPAIQQLNEVLKRNPQHAGALRELAAYYLERQDLEKAKEYAGRLLQMNPSDPSAQLVRTATLALQGRYGEVRAELTRLLAQYPHLLEAKLQMAMLLVAEKKYREAEKAFLALYQPGQRDIRPLKGLVEAYLAQKRDLEAVRMLQKEARANASSPQLAALLAQTAERAGEPAVALEAYQKITVLDPKNPQPWMALSRLRQHAGQAAEAVSAAQRATELAPENAAAWGLLAAAQDQAGERPQAIASYRRALQIDPDNPYYMNNLAYLLLDGGAAAEALPLARKAAEKEPTDPNIADTLGLAYLKTRQTGSALQIFKSLTQKNPSVALYRLHFAEALLAQNDPAAARRELETALSLKPSPQEEGRIRALLASR